MLALQAIKNLSELIERFLIVLLISLSNQLW
jgi:hypothetical protein